MLRHGLATLDVPIFARLHAAWVAADVEAVRRWNDLLYAARGSRELQDEDRRLATALARALVTLELPEAEAWVAEPRAAYPTLFALAAVCWQIPVGDAAGGLLFAWCENQAAAAMRLVPLGQSAGLRLCGRAIALIPGLVAAGLQLPDEEIGTATPGVGYASARHETQYSRIFRS